MNPERAGLLAWAALLLLQPLWYLWWAVPVGGAAGFALLLTVTPLLLPLLALRRSTARALLWVGILSLGYFCHGIVAAWAVPSARWPALLEVLLCVVLIGTLGWQVRSQRRARRIST